MSQTYPVPSKGALRVLRRIALGTSCTIAFGVGVITEDRRRRIRSAQQVFENGQRIKSSRKYHSAGSLPASPLENEIAAIGDRGHWKQQHVTPSATDGTSKPLDAVIPKRLRLVHDFEFDENMLRPRQALPMLLVPNLMPSHTPVSIAVSPIEESRHRPSLTEGRTRTKKSVSMRKQGIPTATKPIRAQKDFARCMETILGESPNEETVDAAISLFLNTWADELRIEVVDESLIDVCAKLYRACEEYEKLDDFLPVLTKVLSLDGLREMDFYSLNTPEVIKHLLNASGIDKDDGSFDVGKLEQAIGLFFTKVTSAVMPSSKMYQLGLELCAASRKAKLYNSTKAIYLHMDRFRGDEPDTGFQHLILASHESGDHRKAVDDFLQLSNTEGRQIWENTAVRDIWNLGSAVLDSALRLQTTTEHEAVLFKAAHLSREAKIEMPTTWFLWVLGFHWKSSQNVSSTQALFERLKSFFDDTHHPAALYGAMIQFCIESNNEELAREYIDGFKAIKTSPVAQLRVMGHFALAKAMRNDWEGVKRDLMGVKDLEVIERSDFVRIFAGIFTPILKLFAASHSVKETELFVRFYVDECDLVPNDFICNFMVGEYVKEEELQGIEKWIEYSRSWECRLDPVLFNTILTQLRDKWHLPFNELLHFCQKASAIHKDIISQNVLIVLRTSAGRASKHNHRILRRLLHQIEALNPALYQENRMNLLTAMRECMSQKDPQKALRLFQSALEEKRHIDSKSGAIAIEACLQTSRHDDLDAIMDTLSQVISRGCEPSVVITPLLLHRIEAARDTDGDITVIFDRILAAMEVRGVEVHISAVTKMVSVLNNKRLHRSGIELWKAMAMRKRITTRSLDVAALTVLMEAYVHLSDLRGMDWVMTVLSQNKIIPDRPLRDLVKMARNDAEKELLRNPDDSYVRKRLNFLHQAVQYILTRRAEGNAMREKAQRDVLELMERAVLERAVLDTSDESKPVPEIHDMPANQTPQVFHTLDQSELAPEIQDMSESQTPQVLHTLDQSKPGPEIQDMSESQTPQVLRTPDQSKPISEIRDMSENQALQVLHTSEKDDAGSDDLIEDHLFHFEDNYVVYRPLGRTVVA